MPKTKSQELAFAWMMSLAMAFGMEQYNLGIVNGGFEMWMFKAAWHWTEVPLMTCIVFVMEHYIAGPIARRHAMKLVTPGKDNPFFVTAMVSCCTVQLMCPIMSFWATLIFKFHGMDTLLSTWLQTLVCNLPMALLWQLFFAGPFVRWAFKKLYAKQLSADAAPALEGEAAV